MDGKIYIHAAVNLVWVRFEYSKMIVSVSSTTHTVSAVTCYSF
jgi:hypothetical protein